MRWASLSIRTKILLVNIGVALLSAALLAFILVKLRVNAGNMQAQIRRISSQDSVADGQRKQIDGQFALLEQQLQLQDERDRAAADLSLSRDAAAHFLRLTYWLTDLALSMQNESEREAKQQATSLIQVLDRLAAADPEAVAALKPLASDFTQIMMQAVDSYADENRVRGNSLAAQARAKANLAIDRLQAMRLKLDAKSAAIDGRLTALNQRLRQAGGQVLDASKQLDEARVQVRDATLLTIAANRSLQGWAIFCIAAGFVLGLTVAWLLARSLTRRTHETLFLLEAVAAGDLTQRQRIDSQDELGRMAQVLNTTLDILREAMRTIASGSQALATSSKQLQDVSQRVDADVAATSKEAIDASSSAGQVSSSMESLTAGIQEMNHSIDEIAKNAHAAASVSASAVGAVATTTTSVAQLSEASVAIGEIAKVISGIAAQTNLLALNATIEAARAGEAGKGFAVVASEVKELARQTAAATEDINKRIGAIQASSASTSGAIAQIGVVIRQVNEFQQSIAGAVEEQAATTREISGNISQAAQGSARISANLGSVVAVTKHTCMASAETRTAAAELDRLASQLAKVSGKFSC